MSAQDSLFFGWYGTYFSRWHSERLARYGIKVIAQPVAEPISLADARLHLKVDPSDDSPPTHPDDSLIAAQLSAAREWCEGWLGLSLATQTLEMGRGGFPGVYGGGFGGGGMLLGGGAWTSFYAWMELPLGPVQSIVSVKYIDGNGVEQTLDPSTYVLDSYSQPARIFPASGTSWPITMIPHPNGVRVRYIAGYSLVVDSPDDDSPPDVGMLPWSLRAMILLVLGNLYANREDSTELKLMELPLGAIAMGERYRARLGMA